VALGREPVEVGVEVGVAVDQRGLDLLAARREHPVEHGQ